MSETPLDRHCESCVFFRPFDTDEGSERKTGRCHRFPPTSGRDSANDHPIVTNGNFCGEYKRS